MMGAVTDETSPSVRRSLPSLMVGRFVTNLTYRTVFPFTRSIADDLETSLSTIGILLSGRDLAGLSAAPIGARVDRGHHRRVMVVAVLAAAVSAVALAIGASLWWLGAGLVLFGVAKPAFDTAMGAWIGEHVAFHRRGRIVGITELTWAGSFLLGVPLAALLVERYSWRAPFAVLAGLQVIAALGLARSLPPDQPHPASHPHVRLTLRPRTIWLFPAVVALVFGHQLVIVTFGAWLDDEHGLDAESLGLVAVGLGFAELVGTAATVWLADHVGKSTTMVGGMALMLPAVGLFGVAESTAASVIAVAVALAGFEVAFIASLPLTSEIAPASRGAVMGMMTAAWTVARAVGAILGTRLYDQAGIGPVGVVAAVAIGVAALLMIAVFREPEP